MTAILAERLSEKPVIGSDGTEIGTLYNITMDLETGRLQNLLVSPSEEGPSVDYARNDEGQYTVPVHNVQSVKDHIVVRR